MKLKTIFLLGYLLLGFIAVLLGATGIYFIERLSSSPDRILKDNYGSILAAQNMIDELDNMDNSFIIIIAGKKERAYADSLFTKASGGFFNNLALCENNITEPGETELLAKLRGNASDYIALYNSKIITDISAYDTLVAPVYSRLKLECYNLLNLNHKGMLLRRDETVKVSESAELYMIVVAAISLLILVIAVAKMPALVVNPISEFTKKVEAIAERKYSERIENVSTGELGKLAVSFNKMAAKLEEYDKTNLEKIIAEKKRTEAIVKNMIDGIIVLDENNRIILVNNIGVELLGTGESELLGRDIIELSEKNNLINNITRDFVSEEKDRSKLNYLRIVFRDKEEFFLKEIVRVQDDSKQGNMLGSIIILKNVTGFKELDELKSGFVATVSHEIRTPLSAMNMSLRLLQDERIGELNDEQLRITNSMKEEVKRLLKLVSELLDLSKIESGGDILKFQNVRAEELIDAAVTPMLMQFEQKNINLNTSIEPNLPGLMLDANKIAWVLINLLNNAVRYSKEGSNIDIKVKKDPGRVIFSVKDYGTGIEPQYLTRIFDKFVQVSSGNMESRNRGVGLGLAISKEFVNAHGGDIWVKSELGIGSEFFFSIPA
jgi:two-component system, NtrC family, sensor histidine kinase KinB